MAGVIYKKIELKTFFFIKFTIVCENIIIIIMIIIVIIFIVNIMFIIY